MLAIKKTNEIVEVNNKQVNVYTGGFSENIPCVLLDDVAVTYDVTVKHLSELLRKHKDIFTENDMIDIMAIDKDLALSILKDKYNANTAVKRVDLYVFSEQGYIKLVSLMRNSKKKKEVMNEFIETYFAMREQLRTVAALNPDTFIDSLPKMFNRTTTKYFKQLVTPNNVDIIVPRIIARLKGLSHREGAGGLSAAKKMDILTACINAIDDMKSGTDLKIYDVAKLEDYRNQLTDYRHNVIKGSNAGFSTKAKEYKKELDKTKELLVKMSEEKAIIEKPVITEQNIYEDLLRSFKTYRNYLAKVWDESMEEVCNTYYDRIPVKLPQAKECNKMGYQSKFEYCYSYYPEETKNMVNIMYRDCCYNGYLEREK